jgi:hypothetical protein
MGFFSSKKTYVASTVYNLAGDIDQRPSYLKSLLIGSIVGSSNSSIAETFHNGYMQGPAMRLRRFFNWAVDNYGLIGVPTGNLGSTLSIDASVVESFLPAAPVGYTNVLQQVEGGPFDYSYWAEQWMFENHPTLVDTLWSSDMDEAGQITITFEDLTTASFTPVVNKDGIHIYAIYSQVDDLTADYGYAKMWIYEIGTGNAVLDEMIADDVADSEYVPYIPVRLDNQFLSPTFKSAAYELSKKAYKKILGGKFDELVEALEDNEQLDEIDYAYVMFGVPLNVKERASREYLYRFFEKCRLSQTTGSVDYALYEEAFQAYLESKEAWNVWKAAQSDPLDPLYGTPEPEILEQPTRPSNRVKIRSTGSVDTNVSFTISWGGIAETTGVGLKKPDATKGEIWLTTGSASSGSTDTIITGGTILGTGTSSGAAVNIHWQIDEDNWKTLTITSLRHENNIYKSKSVEITGAEALEDLEESGFLVPLHMATVREMRLIDSTQMMTAAAYVVLNSYKTVKKKWYQTGVFKIVMFIAIVVISVVTFGGAAPGLLGTALAVGTAVGLTGIAAIIAGTVINMLAAMIISKLIMAGATEFFGAKWGALIGSIVSLVVMNVGAGVSSGLSLSQMGAQLASAQSIMQITNAIGSGISGYLQGAAM